MKIRTVIMCHNTPESSELLYRQLSGAGGVEVFDSGSDEDKRPKCPHASFDNLYWTGCWEEAMRRHGDADFLWVLGGDVVLMNEPWHYYKAMEDVARYKIACWSPAVSGTCRNAMSEEKARGRVLSVFHVEGIAMAASGQLMKELNYAFPPGNKYGWGVDWWMSRVGWDRGMRNVVDGRVAVRHPAHRGYDGDKARDEMCAYLQGLLGENWRHEIKIAATNNFDLNIRESKGEV